MSAATRTPTSRPSGSGTTSQITMEQPIGSIGILGDGLIRRGFGFLNVNDAIDSMAAQCGRDRAEIESLVDEAERARASPKRGRVSRIAWRALTASERGRRREGVPL